MKQKWFQGRLHLKLVSCHTALFIRSKIDWEAMDIVGFLSLQWVEQKKIGKTSHGKSQSYTWQRKTISESEFCLWMFGPSQRKDRTASRTARSLRLACFLQDVKTALLLWFIAKEYLLPVLLRDYHCVSLGIIRVEVKKACVIQVSHCGEFKGIREEAEDPRWRSLSLKIHGCPFALTHPRVLFLCGTSIFQLEYLGFCLHFPDTFRPVNVTCNTLRSLKTTVRFPFFFSPCLFFCWFETMLYLALLPAGCVKKSS